MTNFENLSFTSVQSRSADTADSTFGAVELNTLDNPEPSITHCNPQSFNTKIGLSDGSSQNDTPHGRYDGEAGESSVFGASFNFINSIVGAGIIGK